MTVVVLAVALGGWVHGPLSDRVGRRHVMVTSAALLVVPTALLGLAPGMEMLLALRFVQGALMPGLLVVAVPYVTERFHGPAQGRAMGAYTSSLVLGGFVGRVGTAVLAGWTGLATGVVAAVTAGRGRRGDDVAVAAGGCGGAVVAAAALRGRAHIWATGRCC